MVTYAALAPQARVYMAYRRPLLTKCQIVVARLSCSLCSAHPALGVRACLELQIGIGGLLRVPVTVLEYSTVPALRRTCTVYTVF